MKTQSKVGREKNFNNIYFKVFVFSLNLFTYKILDDKCDIANVKCIIGWSEKAFFFGKNKFF